jgi:hypothetical protein
MASEEKKEQEEELFPELGWQGAFEKRYVECYP